MNVHRFDKQLASKRAANIATNHFEADYETGSSQDNLRQATKELAHTIAAFDAMGYGKAMSAGLGSYTTAELDALPLSSVAVGAKSCAGSTDSIGSTGANIQRVIGYFCVLRARAELAGDDTAAEAAATKIKEVAAIFDRRLVAVISKQARPDGVWTENGFVQAGLLDPIGMLQGLYVLPDNPEAERVYGEDGATGVAAELSKKILKTVDEYETDMALRKGIAEEDDGLARMAAAKATWPQMIGGRSSEDWSSGKDLGTGWHFVPGYEMRVRPPTGPTHTTTVPNKYFHDDGRTTEDIVEAGWFAIADAMVTDSSPGAPSPTTPAAALYARHQATSGSIALYQQLVTLVANLKFDATTASNLQDKAAKAEKALNVMKWRASQPEPFITFGEVFKMEPEIRAEMERQVPFTLKAAEKSRCAGCLEEAEQLEAEAEVMQEMCSGSFATEETAKVEKLDAFHRAFSRWPTSDSELDMLIELAMKMNAQEDDVHDRFVKNRVAELKTTVANAARTAMRPMVVPGMVKALRRFTYNVMVKYNGRFARCRDVIRATIHANSLAAVADIVEAVYKSNAIIVVREKDRFNQSAAEVLPIGGYRVVLCWFNFEFASLTLRTASSPNRMMSEVPTTFSSYLPGPCSAF